ncbi:hypothetical protein DPMN_062579 [Dreissena polymorpha]|uniref:Uncharacterized protein n=1 Tax=Dreissena polymorpha TaxID=45954 RepID=A0A9D4C8Z7_DREPO|nr:hypothetical protein DPMN_062579 [Dreissena polymorpha]
MWCCEGKPEYLYKHNQSGKVTTSLNHMLLGTRIEPGFNPLLALKLGTSVLHVK